MHHRATARARQRILDFVARVTDPASPDHVPAPERIATFDNDGTLWAEKPVYFQLPFAVDRVRELAPRHPEWKEQQPFKGVLEGDVEAVGRLDRALDEAGDAGWVVVGIARDWKAVFPSR